MILGTIVVFLLIPVVALIANAVEENNNTISFDPSYEESGLPVITLTNNDKEFNFLVDTGANLCVLNESHLGEIGHEPLEGTGTMFGMEGNVQNVTYVKVELARGKRVFKIPFQVVNIDNAFKRVELDYGITIHGVLGTQFLDKNKVKVNFIERSIAYGKPDKSKTTLKKRDK